MKFYDEISDFYDSWNPWKERLAGQLPFLEQVFQEFRASRIMDAGCGTGRMAVELACKGYAVTAVDSSERMLERARGLADKRDAELTAIKADITKPIVELDAPFDVLLCAGGTPAHLFGRPALTSLIHVARAALRPGGALILHIPNFEKLLSHRVKYLPLQVGTTPDGQEVICVTMHEYGKERVNVELVVLENSQSGWSQHPHRTSYFPWTAEQVLKVLRKEGFEEPLAYGDFDYVEFDSDRHNELVVIAETPTGDELPEDEE